MTRLSETAASLSRDILDTGMEAAMLAVEANVVISYRSFRLFGFGAPTAGEINRMLAEKPPAFAASALAAGLSAITGKRPDQVLAAAIHPLRSETNRNVRRLGGADAPTI